MNCPTCNQDVLVVNDLTLNPQPGRLGRHLKDGTILSGDQIRDPNIRGHYEHHCLPKHITKPTTQSEQTLF